jgi:hypothetical protein
MNHDELMRIRAWRSLYSCRCVCVCVWIETYAGNIGLCLLTSLYSFIISKNKLLYNTSQVFQMLRLTCSHMRCCGVQMFKSES